MVNHTISEKPVPLPTTMSVMDNRTISATPMPSPTTMSVMAQSYNQ